MYFVYCIIMGRDEREFFSSSIAKIAKMMDMYADKMNMERAAMSNEYYESKYFTEKAKLVNSMKDIV